MGQTLALLIPAYNAADCLPRLLESAARQTEPFDEIWVYDDASQDDTAAVAERHGAKVVRGEANVGCSRGKDVLARAVSADWLHFHDADDLLLPNFVALARKWMEAGRHDVVLFDFEYRDEGSGELLSASSFDGDELARDPRSYALRVQINPFCGLYRRGAYLKAGGYDLDPAVLYNEDVAFHVRLAFAGLSFAVEPEVSIVNFRRRGSMSMANGLKCAQAHVAVMRKALTLPGAERYHGEIAARLWAVSGLLGAYGDWATADSAVTLAQRLAPPPAEAGAGWFRALAGVTPRIALRLRERAIRLLKPHLRAAFRNDAEGQPGAVGPLSAASHQKPGGIDPVMTGERQ